MYSGSSTASFDKKMSAKSTYLLKTSVEASSAFRWAIWALFERYTSSSEFLLRVATYTIKASYSGSRATTAIFLFPISSTCLVVRSTSPVLYKLYYKSQAWKSISALLMVRKTIQNTIASLTLGNKKPYSRNLSLLSLFDREKVETTIL